MKSFVENFFVCAVMAFMLGGCSYVAARRGYDQMQAGNCKAAIANLTPAVNNGFGPALDNLGVIEKSGCPEAGMEPDPIAALHNFERAGTAGVPVAFSNAANMLEEGFAIPPDKAGIPGAPGLAYFPPDLENAIRIFTLGARYGDAPSIAALSRLGQPIPSTDLKDQAGQARQQQQMDIAIAVVGVANAMSHPASRTMTAPLPRDSTPKYTTSVTGFWTGQQVQVQTVTYKQALNCQYSVNGQYFWRVFEGLCPPSTNAQ